MIILNNTGKILLNEQRTKVLSDRFLFGSHSQEYNSTPFSLVVVDRVEPQIYGSRDNWTDGIVFQCSYNISLQYH